MGVRVRVGVRGHVCACAHARAWVGVSVTFAIMKKSAAVRNTSDTHKRIGRVSRQPTNDAVDAQRV